MKLVMLSNFSLNNKCVVDLTLANHYEYCAKYNIDILYTQSKYQPYNDLDEIENLWNRYDAVITVGTDILFTNAEKNICDFISEGIITIQKESYGHLPNNSGYALNGDFIIWKKPNTEDEKEFWKIFKQLNKTTWATQETITCIVYKNFHSELSKFISILEQRQMQSICPVEMYPNVPDVVRQAYWQPGDFSVHCFTCGHAQSPQSKAMQISTFIKAVSSHSNTSNE